MFPCSQGFHDAVKAAGRHFYTKAIINSTTTLYGDGTDGAVVDITFEDVLDSDEMTLGGTPSSSCTMTIRLPSAPLTFANGTFQPFVGMMVNGSVEYIPLGLFNITDAKSNNNATITLTGYDNMYRLAGTYQPTVSFPATVSDVMNDICRQTGVVLNSGLSDITLDTFYECTYRDMVGWIAGLHGRSAKIERDYNGIVFVQYNDQDGLTIGADEEYMNGTEATSTPFVIQSITSGTEEAPLITGNGVGITFTNPYMTQEILDDIGASLIGTTFYPATCEWRGDPCVEAGDIATIDINGQPQRVRIMSHTLSVTGGLKDTIRCEAKSDAEMAFSTSPTQQKIKQVYTALQSAIAQATALINGTKGGVFEVTDSDGDGVNDGWIIKASPDPNYIGNVIVANYNGIGFSTDGGATFSTAITTDGHINGQYIAANTIDVNTLTVGNSNDQFSSYVYIGRRRPNDDTTDMVIRLGVASQSMIQEIRGNRTSMFKAADVQTYIDAAASATEHTDAWLDSQALMYYSDTDYVLLNLGSFRIGNMLMQAQENGGVKFIKAGD